MITRFKRNIQSNVLHIVRQALNNCLLGMGALTSLMKGTGYNFVIMHHSAQRLQGLGRAQTAPKTGLFKRCMHKLLVHN